MSKLDRIRTARRESDFNLSFLDIMACGLGAVILIFLIIKHNSDRGSVEADTLAKSLETLEQAVQSLRIEVENTAELNADEERLGEDLEQQRQSAQTALAAIDARLTNQQETNTRLKEANERTEQEKAADLVESPVGGEEQYLLGLRVKGSRVAILLDHSGSMTDEKLIDVFRYKVSTDAQRQVAPKWQRAKRTARWLLNRLPDNGDAIVVGFSEQAQALGDGRWQSLKDPQALGKTLTDIEQLTPTGATNLQGALEYLSSLSPRPSHVYLITDGLPTKVTGRGRRCARGDTISPECRLELFADMTRTSQDLLRRIQMNIVLLPLEGDWAAADAYWNLAVATGGLLISPPESWP